jgi:lipopolysaccharide/colanic/teichoic acid biosynthesis glycosyltransferase
VDLTARFIDITAACILLAFTLPLFLLVAIAIKLESPGPVIERQARIGRGGQRFDLLNFRTVRHYPTRPRVAWNSNPTRVGRFLLYTRFASLPQLWNVIQGNLALYSRGGYPPSLLD